MFVDDLDPLLFYKKIIIFAQLHLSIEGKIYVEVHEKYGEKIYELFIENDFKPEISMDMYGRNRMISAHW